MQGVLKKGEEVREDGKNLKLELFKQIIETYASTGMKVIKIAEIRRLIKVAEAADKEVIKIKEEVR